MLVSPRGVSEMPSQTRFGRLGVTVSRRVGGAVVRNRVKRRLREWFRTSDLRHGSAFDCVVIARPPAAALSSGAIQADLDGLCREALAASTS